MVPELLFHGQLLAVLGVDLLLGDPRWLPHPVRGIGWLCTAYEGLVRGWPGTMGLRARGVIAFTLVLATSLGILAAAFFLLARVAASAALVGALLVGFFSLAAGDLLAHSRRVERSLRAGRLEEARQAVAMMVGRDTGTLDQAQISRACVESVGENMVDGITAPLFWALVCAGGAPLTGLDPMICAAFGFIGYKAVNTMDSMYGYKNERYLEFGRWAARADDLCNFLPARISALCLVAAAFVLGYDQRGALRVLRADRLKHDSPNSGHSEAAVAGALGIQLGGAASYFGKETFKPHIGEGLAPPGPEHIGRANRLVVAGSLIFFLGGAAVQLLLAVVC